LWSARKRLGRSFERSVARVWTLGMHKHARYVTALWAIECLQSSLPCTRRDGNDLVHRRSAPRAWDGVGLKSFGPSYVRHATRPFAIGVVFSMSNAGQVSSVAAARELFLCICARRFFTNHPCIMCAPTSCCNWPLRSCRGEPEWLRSAEESIPVARLRRSVARCAATNAAALRAGAAAKEAR
jgi:hypothetical protein